MLHARGWRCCQHGRWSGSSKGLDAVGCLGAWQLEAAKFWGTLQTNMDADYFVVIEVALLLYIIRWTFLQDCEALT